MLLRPKLGAQDVGFHVDAGLAMVGVKADAGTVQQMNAVAVGGQDVWREQGGGEDVSACIGCEFGASTLVG